MKPNTVYYILILLICILFSAHCEEYQDVDPYLSSYKENEYDAYSWLKREIKYDKKDYKISKKKLLSTIWAKDPTNEPWSVLIFYRDDVFKIGSINAGVMITGKYVINHDCVQLIKDEKSIKEKYTGFNVEIINLIFNYKSKNFFYEHSLENDEICFYALGSDYENGSYGIYCKETICRLKKLIVANDNVNARMEPSISSEIFGYSLYDYSLNIKKGLILKGTVIQMLGYKPESVIIDKKKSYWFLIKIDREEAYSYLWVFGAYFDDYISERENEYNEILLKEISLRQYY